MSKEERQAVSRSRHQSRKLKCQQQNKMQPSFKSYLVCHQNLDFHGLFIDTNFLKDGIQGI